MNVRWTDEQVAAITAPGHTLLAASAGTGKTTTIVGKVLWSLGLDVNAGSPGTRVPPCPAPLALDRIAAITFTEKAAHDLKDKLRSAVEAADSTGQLRWQLERATVTTIHGFAGELLREHALRLDIDPTFRILDPRETELQQAEVVREAISTALRERDDGAVALTRRYGLAGWKMAPGALDRVLAVMRDLRWRAHQFEHWSTPVEASRYTRTLNREALRERARFAGAWPEDAESLAYDEESLELADALYRLGRLSVGLWLAWLERENARDFDSLILDARRLMTRPETADARSMIRERFQLLIIDEFQDTDWAQWEIARSLAGLDPDDPAEGPPLFLVGDPKQSIYRFRGADIDVWNEARGEIEARGVSLALSSNFRSEPQIVGLVNRVGRRALEETAARLRRTRPASVVEYQALRGERPATRAAGLEWLALDGGGVAAERREQEARRVASRLDRLIGHAHVVDPDDGEERRCRAGDVAILARRNEDLVALEPALRTYGLPFYNTATRGLADQQEVLDLVTALRLVDNRFDDLRAFAFLRSPFVGLRDEVLARIGLHEPPAQAASSYLERAESYLAAVEAGEADWFEAPEAAEIGASERGALRAGLDALREARALVDRVDHARVLEGLLDRTAYRLHLAIRDGAPEALANIERFLALLDEYRHLTLGRFLRLWEGWGDKDLGIPQARLYSSGDDVVTLSTIHAAKGLEWPIVVLVGTDAPLGTTRRLVGTHWVDPDLGPVLLPKQSERGPRAELALARRLEQENAEEARLFYVAATRARDRLIVAAPEGEPKPSFAGWMSEELEAARELHEVSEPEPDPEASTEVSRPRALVEHEPTGTGSQLDVFGDARRQLDLFATKRPPEPTPDADAGFVIVRRGGGARQTAFGPAPVRLDWLAGLAASAWPRTVEDVTASPSRRVGSATERMLMSRDREAWERRYLHGVLEPSDYLVERAPGEPLPARARGTLIHGVLERIREEEELARVLQETIASLGLEDLESALRTGSPYRAALEREIAEVVRSPEWAWYVDGENYRELPFLHRREDGWVGGALDLYLPARTAAAAQGSLFEAEPRGPGAWVIDFKTHRIEESEVERVAAEYAVQIDIYRGAAAALASREGEAPPRVALHFTHPNRAVEV